MGGIFFLTALVLFTSGFFHPPSLLSPSPFKPIPAIAAGSASHRPDKQPLAHFWTSQALLFIVVFSVATNWHF